MLAKISWFTVFDLISLFLIWHVLIMNGQGQGVWQGRASKINVLLAPSLVQFTVAAVVK